MVQIVWSHALEARAQHRNGRIWPDAWISAAGASVRPWRLHDIRRTVATRMAESGVLPHVIEAVLNHVSGHRAGVAGVYNRAIYSEEKRQALQRWAEHIPERLD